MAPLKSLGLAGARRIAAVSSLALRRLFRRPLPAGDDTPASAETARAEKQQQEQAGRDNDTLEGTGSGGKEGSGLDDGSVKIDSMAALPMAARPADRRKENVALSGTKREGVEDVAQAMDKLTLREQGEQLMTLDEPARTQDEDAEIMELTPERELHLKFIQEALDMARLALRTNETPVGCVLVHDGKVIARGMNATNVTRNGTRHAEFMALSALLSYAPRGAPKTTCLKPKLDLKTDDADSESFSVDSHQPDEGNEDGSKGHLYPYGQRCHPDERVDRTILKDCVLYVTVEPCVMCASLLRQLNIKKVYFGAVNDKFGGTGGVFSIHANSLPISADGQTKSAHPAQPTRTVTLPDGNTLLGTSFPPGGGDGGNVEGGYEIEGGWGRDDAVGLLRRFYVQENGRAPVPRKKEGRAARLAAMMEKDGDGGSATSLNDEAAAAAGELDEIPVAPGGMVENIKPLGDEASETKVPAVKMFGQTGIEDGEVLKERALQ